MSRAATSRLKVNPPLGQLPVLQYCAPAQLKIDEGYQRTLQTGPSQSLIRRIAVHWDWSLCQPLIVSRRPDGELYVVDGQHRMAAAALRGDIWQLPCVVASYRDAAEEAASFVALNQQRRPLGRLDIFKAAVLAEDPDAVAVVEALKGAGLTLATSTNLASIAPGSVSNVGGLQECLRLHGRKVLDGAIAVLARAYPGEVLSYAGSIFPGLAAIVAAELKAGGKGGGWKDSDRCALLVEMVAGATQAEWRQDLYRAKEADLNLNYKRASAVVFEAAWAECTEAMLDEAA